MIIAATPLAFIPVLAQAPGIPWGYMLGGLLTQIVVTILTWVVASKVTSAVLAERNKSLQRSVSKLCEDVENLSVRVAAVSADRSGCELHAARSFATKENFVQTLVEVSANHRETMEKLDSLAASFRNSVSKAHGRVDVLVDQVARLEERTENLQ